MTIVQYILYNNAIQQLKTTLAPPPPTYKEMLDHLTNKLIKIGETSIQTNKMKLYSIQS